MTKEEREQAKQDRAIHRERREQRKAEREARRAIRQERRRLRELSKNAPIPRIESNGYNLPPWSEIRQGRVTVITPDGIRRVPVSEADQYALEQAQGALGEAIRMDKVENDQRGQLNLF